MKCMSIVGILLISASSPMLAYIFSFSNHTNYPLRIYVQLSGINEPWEMREIPSKKRIEYDWTAAGHYLPSLNIWKAGFCLKEMRVETPQLVKTTKIDDDGNAIVTYVQDIERDNSGKPILGKDGKPQVAWNPQRNVVITWVKDEAYDAIVNSAKLFADGLSALASQAASIALGGVPMPEFKLSPIGDLIGTALKYSFCTDRHIDIVEDAEFSTLTEKSFKFLIPGRI